MTERYRTVVGLEVHIQLLTHTKLFCGCGTRFGEPPNSQTCPVCLGMPGALPVMNRHALELALRAALALNCRVNRFTKWDRKNYYYPDLPKNYQISQYDRPLSYDGHLEIPSADGGLKKIGIIRAHLEEDAGKLIHDESGRGGDSRVDLNRTGTPLVEIVSQPEINSPEEARTYLEEMRLIMRELGVSDCEMQEGSLRCDANVNIHIPRDDGTHVATPLVEIKNLNSISAVEKAIAYEAQRQFDAYHDPDDERHGLAFGELPKGTWGWDERRGRTWEQRRKEEAADYRYFPDPDLVPVVVDDAWLDRVREGMGELPARQRERLQREPYSLTPYEAGVLTAKGRGTVAYYEAVVAGCGDPKAASNWLINDVMAELNERRLTIDEFPVEAQRLGGLIAHINKTRLNRQPAREVFRFLLGHPGVTAAEAAERLGFRPMADAGELRGIVLAAIALHPGPAEDFRKGKQKAVGRIVGEVMKRTKGAADPAEVQKILEQELLPE